MSAESGNGVERFDCTNGGAQYCQGCYTMTPDSDGEYVRHEDYAKLEQQRASLEDRVTALVEALKGFVNNSSAQVNMPAECEQAEAALRAAGGSDMRIVLEPGYVTSKADGERHWISAHKLACLYGVKMKPGSVVVDTGAGFRARPGDVVLGPRSAGDYEEHLTNLMEAAHRGESQT